MNFLHRDPHRFIHSVLFGTMLGCFFLSFGYAQDFPPSIDQALDEYERARQPFLEEEPLPEENFEDEMPSDAMDPAQAAPAPEVPAAGDMPSPASIQIESPEGTQEVSELLYSEMIDVLQLKDMDIVDALKLIAQKSNLNIIAGKDITGKVTIYLKDVKLADALRIILDSNKLAYKVEDGIVRVMTAQEFEERYGFKFGGKIQTIVKRLIYANANDMVTMLNQIKSSRGKIVFDAKSNTLVLIDAPEKLVVMEKLIQEIDIPVETQFFDLNYAAAKDVADKLTEVLTQNVGNIKFDERSNKIVVTDTPVKLQKIAQVIGAFDVKEEQVLIEAKIIQIILSDQQKFGVDWQALIKEYHDLTLSSNFDILSSNEKFGRLSIGTISSDNYTALLEALHAVGDTNILSSPSITALNNQEAKILVGSTEPYVTTTTTTTASGPTTTAESVNFIDVGVKLYVTPTIHRDRFITMRIKPEVSSVTSTVTTSNNNTIPVVDTSEAETMVMVKDGVTIVIGGLIKEEKIESRNKVPFLGDIPLLGLAFQNNDKLVRKTEIVIFLTPRIITGDVPEDNQLDRLTGLPQ